MPVYESECQVCGKQADYFASIAERDSARPYCCGMQAKQIITTATFGYVQTDVCYESPSTGKIITSRQARLDDLKRSRCRPYEGLEQEKKEAARQRAYQDKKHDAKLEDATRRAYHQLDPKKRRILEENA